MKKTLLSITGVIGLALVALLAYSVERSAWLLSLYETVGEGSYGPTLAMVAALVAELGAIALIIAEGAIGLLDHRTARRLARWANLGLIVVLSLQSVAGLVAGYTRGGARMLDALGAGDSSARFAVAAVALLLGNLAAPALILALSKIAGLLVAAIVALPPSEPATRARRAFGAMPSYARPAGPAELVFNGSEPEKPALYPCKKCGQQLTFSELGKHARSGCA